MAVRRSSSTRRPRRFTSDKQRRAAMAKLRAAGKLEKRHTLILANQGLVHKVARRFKKAGVSYGDLIQEGNLGLMKAAEKFKPRKGKKFSTYAHPWIKTYVQRALAKGFTVRVPEKKLGKVKKPELAAMSEAFQLGGEGGIERAGARAFVAKLRRRLPKILTKQQARVIIRRYFEDHTARPEPLTTRRVARMLKMSAGRVSQLEKAARRRLKQKFKEAA